MYALYFVCYGASLVITYVAHLSLRGSIHHKNTSNNGSNSSSVSQDQQSTDPGADGGSTHSGCLWSEWSRWSQCTVTCGSGVQVRHRSILRLPTQNYTQCASEEKMQEKPCSSSVRCFVGNKIYEFPSFRFLFDDEAYDTDFSTQSSDVYSSHTTGNIPLSEEVHQSTDASRSQQPEPNTNPLPPRSTPSDADHQNVFRVDPSASLPPRKSGTGEWQSRPHNKEDTDSNSYCSSFDCGTPESPDGDRRNFWNNFVEDLNEKRRKVEDHSEDGEQATEQTNEDRREFEESQHRSESYQRQTRDNRESHQRSNKQKRSWNGKKFVHDKDDLNYDSDEEAEKGRGTDEEKIDEEHHDGNPDEDSGDGIDEDDYEDEWAASGEEGGSQDGENHEDEESGSKKRRSSIPEDEEMDDKEEIEEDENEAKKKKRRKKRKRKQKSCKAEAETTEGVEQDESYQNCDNRDEHVVVCQMGLSCDSSTSSHVESTSTS